MHSLTSLAFCQVTDSRLFFLPVLNNKRKSQTTFAMAVPKASNATGNTCHQLKLVHVFRLSVAVLHFLRDEQANVKQEQAALSAFLYQLLRIPNGEVVLQQNFTERIQHSLHIFTAQWSNLSPPQMTCCKSLFQTDWDYGVALSSWCPSVNVLYGLWSSLTGRVS